MENCLNLNKFQILNFDELKINLKNRIDWNICYRGEGNEHLILFLPDLKLIFRFHKNLINETPDKVKELFRISFMYHYCFIQYLFTNTYSTLPILAEISDSDVEKLQNMFSNERPNYRKKKKIYHGALEIFPDYTFFPLYSNFLVHPDHYSYLKYTVKSCPLKELLSSSYLNYRSFIFSLLKDNNFVNDFLSILKQNDMPIFCIEIKPKQAWIVKSDYPFNLCMYCMNQYYKLNEHKITCRSNYCPLDLFSGDLKRMKYAVKELLKTPQNNFKVFKNGEVIFGDNFADYTHVLRNLFNITEENSFEWYIENFCFLIASILVTEFDDRKEVPILISESYIKTKNMKLYSDEDIALFQEKTRFLNLNCKFENLRLPTNCILNRIMNLQRADQAGLTATMDFYETHLNEFTSDYCYISNLISRIKFCGENIEIPALNMMEAYLFSAAAKDLSILIVMKHIASDDESSFKNVVRDLNNQLYAVNISVADVGPKPLSCIKKHWERNKKILLSCLNSLS